MESLKVLKAGHWLSQCLLALHQGFNLPPFPPSQKHKGNLKKKTHPQKPTKNVKNMSVWGETKNIKKWFLGPTYKKHHAAGSRQRHLDQLFSNRPAAGF